MSAVSAPLEQTDASKTSISTPPRQVRTPDRSRAAFAIPKLKPWHAAERLIYVIAGLPIAIRGGSLPGSPAAQEIRRAFAHLYWHPKSVRDAIELSLGLLLAPLAVPLAALWFTARNGPSIRIREGKGLTKQFGEQLRLYCLAGIVGPWYYIFSLHRNGVQRAPTFLQRCETKRGKSIHSSGQKLPSPLETRKRLPICAPAPRFPASRPSSPAMPTQLRSRIAISSSSPEPAAVAKVLNDGTVSNPALGQMARRCLATSPCSITFAQNDVR